MLISHDTAECHVLFGVNIASFVGAHLYIVKPMLFSNLVEQRSSRIVGRRYERIRKDMCPDVNGIGALRRKLDKAQWILEMIQNSASDDQIVASLPLLK